MVKRRPKVDGNYYPSEDVEPQNADSDSEAETKIGRVIQIKAKKDKLSNAERQKKYRERCEKGTAKPDVIANYDARC